MAVSGIEFELISPEKVNLNTSFDIVIESDSSEVCDVKAYVQDDKKSVSEIFNDGWKSPNYYIKSAFPSNKKFSLISHYLGESKVCAKLRDPKLKIFEKCNNIVIEETLEENLQEPAIQKEEAKDQQKIILKNNEEKQNFNSNESIVQNAIVLLFSIILLLIFILIVKRKL